MFVNRMPRYEILSEDAIAVLDKGWRRIISELGIEFMHPEALELFRGAGQRVEDNTVFLDPDFVLEQVAKAPTSYDVQARNPARSIHLGGDHMNFAGVSSIDSREPNRISVIRIVSAALTPETTLPM